MAQDSTRINDRATTATITTITTVTATTTTTTTTTTPQHYTMKTSSRPPLVSSHSHARHSQANLQSFRANRTTTPLASPCLPHSVGQPYPPSTKLSPAIPDVRSPSPNYFGLNVEKSAADIRDSAVAPLDHWSPPSSSVKSFGAIIPKQVPLDANPEFEAFRRQVDANRAKGFNLGSAHFAPVHSPLSTRPRPPRLPTNHSDSASEFSLPRSSNARVLDGVGARMDVDTDSLHDSAYVSSDSKRNSEVSLNPPSFSNLPRFESPAQADSPFEPLRRTTLSKADDRHSQLSLPQEKKEQSTEPMKPRAETLPTTLESSPSLILPNQLRDMLQKMPENEFLLLDVRVSTHYAQSRIRGALNLCIPTTLLKRATFNLEKLQHTLQTEEDQQKFAQWPNVKYLIVYDGSSAEKRDAVAAMNMLKKFLNEGFPGNSYLLRGGFHAFAADCPTLIDNQSASERPGTSIASSEGGRPSFAPVIGGVMLPSGANNPNPFFSNIRQNMDLADGVGQMDISVPSNLDSGILPRWLQDATKSSDHGKIASERFLKIERREQSRMKEAYASFNTAPAKANHGVRLSGVEQGGKNRYKDILPFEHARVRLADRADGACDYINASHIQASRSYKRYIATQGPLPATFDDFWSVIWDQDVRVIVMLTAESEGGQLKCHPYWQNKEFGLIRLRPLSEKKVSLDIDKHRPSLGTASSSGNNATADYGRRRALTTTTLGSSAQSIQPPQSQPEAPYVIVRKFALSHAGHPFSLIREITQLQYPSWPDFGAPAQPSHLLALVELANVMQRAALPVDANSIAASVATENPAAMSWFDEPESDANARPILVHCSAGCGRTGTFCTVDSVIDMLKRQRLASMDRPDVDGDVSMKGGSPERRRSAATGPKPGSAENGRKGIETGWLEDASLDLVEMTVEDFRKQRLSMVQSLRQFVLCYETVVEWVWRLQEKTKNTAGGRGRPRSEIFEPRR
ncbi:phosphotyrosine-specific ptp2-like protein [Parahypoxylon ruwenzoriense]